MFRPSAAAQPLDDRIGLSGLHGPNNDGAIGTGDRVPRRPPEAPLADAVALPEPSPEREPSLRR